MAIDWTENIGPKQRPAEIQAAMIVAASNIMASLIASQGLASTTLLDDEVLAKKSANYQKAMEVAIETAKTFADAVGGVNSPGEQ